MWIYFVCSVSLVVLFIVLVSLYCWDKIPNTKDHSLKEEWFILAHSFSLYLAVLSEEKKMVEDMVSQNRSTHCSHEAKRTKEELEARTQTPSDSTLLFTVHLVMELIYYIIVSVHILISYSVP